MLEDYDKSLIKVVEKHEVDFLNAYKTHMQKVERELISLKAKAAQQEERLKNDERVLKLEKSVAWFSDEMARLQRLKEDGFNSIDMLSTKVQTMIAEKRFMEEQVKASKRQNKLLVMALAKQEGHQTQIEDSIAQMNRSHVEQRKKLILMPPLQVSPFAKPEEAAAFIGYGAMIDQEIEKNMPKGIEITVQNT